MERTGFRALPLLFLASAALASACGDDGRPPAGSEGGPCYGNGTCNDGLTCLSELCVLVPDVDAAPPVDASPPVDAAPQIDASVAECNPVGVEAGQPSTGCDAGEACFTNTFMNNVACNEPFCDESNLCTVGSDCQCVNCCHPGKGCSVLNADATGISCAKLCIPPEVAFGLTEPMLPLDMGEHPIASLNGQAPWNCGRLNDGDGQPDDPLLAPDHICIPLGGDDAVRYWGDLTTADGWPFGSQIGVCIDTNVSGNPYYGIEAPTKASGLPQQGGSLDLVSDSELQKLFGNPKLSRP